jgi:hypothetical protein
MKVAPHHLPRPIPAFAFLLALAVAPPARADADFLPRHQGEFFCALKSSATGSLGKSNSTPAPQPPSESAPQPRQRTEQIMRDIQKNSEAAAKLTPIEVRLSIVVRNGSAFLDLHFANVPPSTSLQDLEINVAPASSASPTVRRTSGALPGQTVLATATATSFTAYWIEPETSEGPVYRQIHLTSAAGTVDLVVWVVDSNGRRGAGRACVMDRR